MAAGVAGGPAALGPEGLGLGGLGVRHDPGPVLVEVEGDNPVVADPEPLAAPGEVGMPGREAQHPCAGVAGARVRGWRAGDGHMWGVVGQSPRAVMGHTGLAPVGSSGGAGIRNVPAWWTRPRNTECSGASETLLETGLRNGDDGAYLADVRFNKPPHKRERDRTSLCR